MYDRKQEPNEFVGESVDDATSAAARFFGVEAAELKVKVAPEGAISGAAGRTVVVAFPKNVSPAKPGAGGDDSRDRGDRGGRDRDRGGRGGRDRDRGRGRGDRGDRGDRGEQRGEKASRREAAEEPSATEEESKGSPQGELGPVGDFVLGVVERMVVGGFEISESSESDFLVYQITGDASQWLGGGDGRALDALQLLANQAAKQLLDEAPRVVIDVEGGAEERESTLERLASRAAARAADTGRAIALDPMNSRDRRIVHVALRDEDKIATMSIGSGRYRQVVVVPEGAPEYEEALESSKQSD